MKKKIITLRKISTGGILNIEGKSATDIISTKGLNPLDWEEFKAQPEREDTQLGDNQRDGREEDN